MSGVTFTPKTNTKSIFKQSQNMQSGNQLELRQQVEQEVRQDLIRELSGNLEPEQEQEESYSQMEIFEKMLKHIIKTTIAELSNNNKRYKDINDYPDIMKVNDVQEYLRIGTNAAYDFLNHPKCPTMRYGNSIRIKKANLLQFIDEWEAVKGDV